MHACLSSPYSKTLKMKLDCQTNVDFECIITVICNLVAKAGTPDEALEMAKLISSKLVQHPDDKPQLRLKMYAHSFYTLYLIGYCFALWLFISGAAGYLLCIICWRTHTAGSLFTSRPLNWRSLVK
jgi:hypothetical protein